MMIAWNPDAWLLQRYYYPVKSTQKLKYAGNKSNEFTSMEPHM